MLEQPSLPKTIDLDLLSHERQNALALPIRQSTEGRKAVATDVYRRFHAMRTYGKEPESLDSIIEVFDRDLGDYPAELILKAMRTHAQRCQEFPTVADIVGLIERNGKPPLSEAAYVQVSRKPGELRTPEDWQYIRDYEQEQRQGWDIGVAAEPQSIRDGNARLRQKVKHLEAEVRRLRLLSGEQLQQRRVMQFGASAADRMAKTVDWMRSTGAPQVDIDAFILSQQSAIQAG